MLTKFANFHHLPDRFSKKYLDVFGSLKIDELLGNFDSNISYDSLISNKQPISIHLARLIESNLNQAHKSQKQERAKCLHCETSTLKRKTHTSS
jgi:hypothetical protein